MTRKKSEVNETTQQQSDIGCKLWAQIFCYEVIDIRKGSVRREVVKHEFPVQFMYGLWDKTVVATASQREQLEHVFIGTIRLIECRIELDRLLVVRLAKTSNCLKGTRDVMIAKSR